MGGKTINNLGSRAGRYSAVIKKYLNEKFQRKGAPIDVGGHSIRNVNQNPIHGDEAVPKQWIQSYYFK